MVISSQMTGRNGQIEDDLIEDESDIDDESTKASYAVTSFGVDFDVDGLVRRLNKCDIEIPDWQRGFIWPIKTASSFVESLLLGLPVPGVFMGTDPETRRLYVIDGQQRLRTLQGFYEGRFPGVDRSFRLTGVENRFEGLTYDQLGDPVRRDLDNSLIHATIVKQDVPANDDTSMYQIFKRLNSGGRAVNPHEIRCAIYHGRLIDTIKELNTYHSWRSVIGNPSKRLKDQEMILRFMAMFKKGDQYTKSMADFLNVFTQENRNPDEEWIREITERFEITISSFANSIGNDSFRLRGGRTVNAAVFDSMSVGLANRIERTGNLKPQKVREVHDALIFDDGYLQAVTRGTSDERSVETRLQLATAAFANA